jgi:hypothetical protein
MANIEYQMQASFELILDVNNNGGKDNTFFSYQDLEFSY